LGSAPDPAGGAYSAPPDLLAGFKGSTSKGREKEERGGERRPPILSALFTYQYYFSKICAYAGAGH